MRVLAIGVLAGLVLALAPAGASALTCARSFGALELLEASSATFVGEAVGQRGEATVYRVTEAFKGVTVGQDVAVIQATWGVPPNWRPPLGSVATIVGGYGADGILHTQLCLGASPEGLRAAAAAQAEGRRCGSTLSSVRAHSARGRLTLRIAVRDPGAWAERVEVRWGGERRTYALPPAAGTSASWRRVEVSRWLGPPGRVLVGVSVLRSKLSRFLCGGGPLALRPFAERTLWRSVR